MPLVVVGSVALDTIETPLGKREEVMGGSAVYFAWAASYFTPVRLVGVVGEDWPAEYTRMLEEQRRIDTTGLVTVPGGKTFRWHGRYFDDMNRRETLDVQLNVMADFDPVLPEACRRAPFVFLANGSTRMQLRVREQCVGASLVVADTMDHWIRSERAELEELLQKIDGLVLNESEAQLLTGESNLIKAGRRALCGWVPNLSWSKRASTVRSFSAGMKRMCCRLIQPKTLWIPPVPATVLPAE